MRKTGAQTRVRTLGLVADAAGAHKGGRGRGLRVRTTGTSKVHVFCGRERDTTLERRVERTKRKR